MLMTSDEPKLCHSETMFDATGIQHPRFFLLINSRHFPPLLDYRLCMICDAKMSSSFFLNLINWLICWNLCLFSNYRVNCMKITCYMKWVRNAKNVKYKLYCIHSQSINDIYYKCILCTWSKWLIVFSICTKKCVSSCYTKLVFINYHLCISLFVNNKLLYRCKEHLVS